jgi:hypothetical protein
VTDQKQFPQRLIRMVQFEPISAERGDSPRTSKCNRRSRIADSTLAVVEPDINSRGTPAPLALLDSLNSRTATGDLAEGNAWSGRSRFRDCAAPQTEPF